jgi:hypothetical protein
VVVDLGVAGKCGFVDLTSYAHILPYSSINNFNFYTNSSGNVDDMEHKSHLIGNSSKLWLPPRYDASVKKGEAPWASQSPS